METTIPAVAMMTAATTTQSEPYGRLPLDLGGYPPGSRFLLGFSGGLDSVYLAWRLLEAGYRLHMFFVEYRTRQMRYLKEIEAHQKVLEWFKARGLTDWTIQRMTVEPGRLGYGHLDWDFFAWACGMILRAPHLQDIDTIAAASCAEDPSRADTWAKHQQIIEILARRKIKLIRPKKRYTKAEFLSDMPPELFQLCWYCRNPGKRGEPCHQCHTCKHVDEALEKGVQNPMLSAKVLHRFRCKYDRKVYMPGETYFHRDPERMKFLAAQNPPRVEWPPKVEPDPQQTQSDAVIEPVHVGGGWYELPDGRRIRGKEAAYAAAGVDQ